MIEQEFTDLMHACDLVMEAARDPAQTVEGIGWLRRIHSRLAQRHRELQGQLEMLMELEKSL